MNVWLDDYRTPQRNGNWIETLSSAARGEGFQQLEQPVGAGGAVVDVAQLAVLVDDEGSGDAENAPAASQLGLFLGIDFHNPQPVA